MIKKALKRIGVSGMQARAAQSRAKKAGQSAGKALAAAGKKRGPVRFKNVKIIPKGNKPKFHSNGVGVGP